MSINLQPVTLLNLFSVKNNFDKVSREAESLQQPTDATYLTSAPAVADLAELQSVYAEIAGTMYRYSKVKGALHRVALTTV